MTAWILMAVLRLLPEMAVREVELATIVDAIATVAWTKEEAAILVSIAYWETGRTFNCSLAGDSGESVSCWQVRVCKTNSERCQRAKTDAVFAADLALGMAKASMRACRTWGVTNGLSVYTTGTCRENSHARLRWGTAQRLLKVVVDEREAWIPGSKVAA